ncbi:hypothetical protein SAMN04488020_11077 [Palleronia marisminoris]|uniref:Lipoprotein n=1 Tax=Palleronia marisminoris TaxID=315423 RepID=A0A1Y5TCN5_9RHOB|nr:hypothetical protein [Palleronia marisminoris]SFH33346.1 hypothetical protein SAMN04488020_11077 [Palleronia marisminoris]SLN60564.1 hypothetical protein PAM7066_03001 [Palleronia marisminoris]
MRKAEIALACALLALGGCSIAKVPVKVAGTAAGATMHAAGSAVMIVTRDRHDLP